jgi:hypothetical protein
MPGERSSVDHTHCSAARAPAVYDHVFVGLILWTLVHTTEALAGEPGPLAGSAARPDLNYSRQVTPASMLMLWVPAPYRALDLPDADAVSTREFRPRRQPAQSVDSRTDAVDQEPIMNRTTVWQRLSDFRIRNRVRLVTLWETGGNSLSLQAGSKGGPTLQWTSRLMNRGRVSHGLIDELFSTSFDGAVGRGLHLAPRAANATNATDAGPAVRTAETADRGLATIPGDSGAPATPDNDPHSRDRYGRPYEIPGGDRDPVNLP